MPPGVLLLYSKNTYTYTARSYSTTAREFLPDPVLQPNDRQFTEMAPLLKAPFQVDTSLEWSYNKYMHKKRLLSRSRDPLQLSNTTPMTLPDERYRSIMQARRLLEELMDPKLTPRVAAGVRDRARGALRHYPSEYDLRKAAQTSPDIFQERMEDLHRFVLQGEQQQQP